MSLIYKSCLQCWEQTTQQKLFYIWGGRRKKPHTILVLWHASFYGFFSKTVNSSSDISTHRMNTWKDYERNWSQPDVKKYLSIYFRGTWEEHKKSIRISNLQARHPKYKAGAPPNQVWYQLPSNDEQLSLNYDATRTPWPQEQVSLLCSIQYIHSTSNANFL